MSYSIKEKLISHNRSHKTLKPVGICVHSTDTKGATAEAEVKYFDSANRNASAHYFIDWSSIIRAIPENEQAWHAGATANKKLLSVELCEPKGNDLPKFIEVWNRAVWFVAEICVRYGWGIDHIYSHKIVSETWHETTHTDPIPYFNIYSRSWDYFKQSVSREMAHIELAKKVTNKKPEEPLQKEVTREEFANELFKLGFPAIFYGPKLNPDKPILRGDVIAMTMRAYIYSRNQEPPVVIEDGRLDEPLMDYELKYVLDRMK
ncbi:MAG: N-acetylmuramoyl-L-alanine amidase family protein [Promethearchaeota archaeon]